MTTYRTGNHWGITIVREPDPRACDTEGTHYCVAEHPGAQLVAVVVNGDQALAERICELLNAEPPRLPAPCPVDAAHCLCGDRDDCRVPTSERP